MASPLDTRPFCSFQRWRHSLTSAADIILGRKSAAPKRLWHLLFRQRESGHLCCKSFLSLTIRVSREKVVSCQPGAHVTVPIRQVSADRFRPASDQQKETGPSDQKNTVSWSFIFFFSGQQKERRRKKKMYFGSSNSVFNHINNKRRYFCKIVCFFFTFS